MGADKPTLKLLMKYRNEIAPYWFNVGMQLLQHEYYYKLAEIRNNYNDVEQCCMQMLQYWLMVDAEASWNKLIDTLQRVDLNTAAARIKRDILSGNVY